MVGTDVSSAQLDGNWSMRDDAVQCDDVLRTQVIMAAQQAGLTVRSGKIVSVPTVVEQAEDKRRLSRLSGAIALDMESSALGAVAARRGVPFVIVRTVSDLVDEDLPLDFNLFLRPTGWLNGMQVLLTHPASLVGLNRLRKQSRMAAERLTKLFVCYAAEGYERNEVMRSS
jgi:adenosylhomocysteine nucleosidase